MYLTINNLSGNLLRREVKNYNIEDRISKVENAIVWYHCKEGLLIDRPYDFLPYYILKSPICPCNQDLVQQNCSKYIVQDRWIKGLCKTFHFVLFWEVRIIITYLVDFFLCCFFPRSLRLLIWQFLFILFPTKTTLFIWCFLCLYIVDV